ncbi:hypothetical protein DESC_720162 [Desulfosarcina cetonica]|nr:hypothetical protein DESC_720162 [Desulfosarcina cetonica]
MGVPGMVFVGRHAIVEGPATGADAVQDATGHEQIEDAVDRYPVDAATALEGVVDVAGREGVAVAANHFEHVQPIGRRFKVGGLQ